MGPLKSEYQQKKQKRLFLVETYQITKAILIAHIEQEQTEQIKHLTYIKEIQILLLFQYLHCRASIENEHRHHFDHSRVRQSVSNELLGIKL